MSDHQKVESSTQQEFGTSDKCVKSQKESLLI